MCACVVGARNYARTFYEWVCRLLFCRAKQKERNIIEKERCRKREGGREGKGREKENEKKIQREVDKER